MARQEVIGPTDLAIGTGSNSTQAQYTATKTPATWDAQVTSGGSLSPSDYTVSISASGLLTITLASGVVVPAPGTSLVVAVSASSGNGNGNNDTLVVSIDIDSTVVPCFLGGTRIATLSGETLVEQLVAGDRVRTVDGGSAVIRWVGSRKVSQQQLARSPKFRPVLFRKNCFGQDLPNRDLYLSPLHRVKLSCWQAELMYGEPSVLVHASHLPEAETVAFSTKSLEYFHLLCDRHEIILANGLPTETLFPSEFAQSAFPPNARQKILDRLSAQQHSIAHRYETALPCLSHRETRSLFLMASADNTAPSLQLQKETHL